MTLDDFAGPATPLAEGDYAAAAAVLKVNPLKIKAVQQVESRGRGFHPDTRRPIILYEPHIFSRLTKGRFDASHPEISYPAWNTLPYPPSQATRYGQLIVAIGLDEVAALASCSWGMFQIMGFNCGPAGFADVRAFVAAMVRSEGEQLMAFARFVAANPGMAKALRDGDWGGFALRYNGASYAQHGYDQRLKTAYAGLRTAAGPALA